MECDRNICVKNEYSGIGCDECVVTTTNNEEDMIIQMNGELKQIADDLIDRAYKKGYEIGFDEGRKSQKDVQNWTRVVDKAEEYQRGLDDAWKCARKIGRLDDNKISEIFGDFWSLYGVITVYEAYEAIKKIKEYEDSNKSVSSTDVSKDDKISVGDEVICDYIENTRYVVTWVDDNYVDGLSIPDGMIIEDLKDKFTKTGRHFDGISEILQKMRGDK